MGKTVVVTDKDHSKLVIDATHIRVLRDRKQFNGDLAGIFSMMAGVSFELGREIEQLEEVIKLTRLPLVLQKKFSEGQIDVYNLVRLSTGSIDNTVLGEIECLCGTVTSYIFMGNPNDAKTNKLIRFSVLHKVAIVDDEKHADKLLEIIRLVTKTQGQIDIDVYRAGIIDFIVQSPVYIIPMVYRCVLDNGRYRFKSISLT